MISPFPIITQKLSKIFSNTERRKLCSVRDSSWVTTAVNEMGQVTVVAGRAYLLRCTSFPFYDCFPNTTEKRRRVFPFPNNHRRPSQILTTLLLLSFLLSVYGLEKFSYSCNAFPHFFFYFYYMENSPKNRQMYQFIEKYGKNSQNSPKRYQMRRFMEKYRKIRVCEI